MVTETVLHLRWNRECQSEYFRTKLGQAESDPMVYQIQHHIKNAAFVISHDRRKFMSKILKIYKKESQTEEKHLSFEIVEQVRNVMMRVGLDPGDLRQAGVQGMHGRDD